MEEDDEESPFFTPHFVEQSLPLMNQDSFAILSGVQCLDPKFTCSSTDELQPVVSQ